ncbi:heparinase II/III family protein [Allorhizobium sp. BGMRC 0089]|uniref:heparinase II/III family protein n=1 Tax=Allorhizobium sonneratiae TaxID=2934936 RepID=UPI00203345E4|nr:heparinase II/III family protein [Allorhizobium sonneratiae]MCM2294327.1 heparinase II/III family protein [Allorhizobium sonneratiae]
MPQPDVPTLPILTLRLIGWKMRFRIRILLTAGGRRIGAGKARLLVAPTDLRAIDPFMASEILQGRFPLAGRLMECEGLSPFSLEPPSRAFAERLHSFSWLRHLRAEKNPATRAHARRLTDSWIGLSGKRRGIAWEADVLSQRLIAWLSHSPVLLQDCDAGFYRRFVKSLMQQIAYARLLAAAQPEGLTRLKLTIALAMASIAVTTPKRLIRRAADRLDEELTRQMLPDGGHISRNPQVVLDLLFDLLPLRQTYINLGQTLPVRLIPTIDRMFPALRFFRHGDGSPALFNGASAILANDLMALLRYDESGGQPFKALPYSGYQRLEAQDSVLLIDTGAPPSGFASLGAHAGALSFEFSSGRHRLVINAGAPRFADERFRQMARATAAHSTLIIADRSSNRLSSSPRLGPIVIDGVKTVEVNRAMAEDGSDHLTARHDGYLAPFGLLHERDLRLNAAGTKLVGCDRLLGADRKLMAGAPPDGSLIRFHIHPSVRLVQQDDHSILLQANGSLTWLFSVPTGFPAIAEDVFFAGLSGMERAQQIEVPVLAAETWWFFSRL